MKKRLRLKRPAPHVDAGARAASPSGAAPSGFQPSGIPTPRPTYPLPAEAPTQQGPNGLNFDFNDGCRVALAENGRPWRVRISDLDTANVLFETELTSGRVNSSKRYFVRFRIEVWQRNRRVFLHDYSAGGRDVLIQFPLGTVGDTIGWFSYAEKFREKHKCRLTCAMDEKLIPLFRAAYADIAFIAHEQVKPEKYYATYNIGLFFEDSSGLFQPSDFRQVGLHRTAAYILGVDPAEAPPRIALADTKRPIAGPYVCISVQSTGQCKYWNNPDGWREVIRYLKDKGYRVVCLDQKRAHGADRILNHIPEDAEDETGRSLSECARWIKHADFFVGLSSGLSWLAWAVGVPVVMISGFTHPVTEFATPYRVINFHGCNSCWNDVRLRVDHADFFWCPRHKGTSREFECTRLITPDQVKSVLRQIPGFGEHAPSPPAAAMSWRRIHV